MTCDPVVEYVYLKVAVTVVQCGGALIYLGLFIQSLIYINPQKSNSEDITTSVIWLAKWCRAFLCVDVLGTMAPDYIPKVFDHEDVAWLVLGGIIILTFLSGWILSKWMIAVAHFTMTHAWFARQTHLNELSGSRYIGAMFGYFIVSSFVTWVLIVQGLHKILKFLSKRKTKQISRNNSYWCEVEVFVFSSWLTGRLMNLALRFQLNDISSICDIPVQVIELNTIAFSFLLLLSLTSGFVFCLIKFNEHVADNTYGSPHTQHLLVSDLRIAMIKLLFVLILFGVVTLIILIEHRI